MLGLSVVILLSHGLGLREKSLMIRSDDSFNVEDGARKLKIRVFDPISERQSPLDYMAQVDILFENMTIQNIRGTKNGGGIHFQNYGWIDPMITVSNSTFISCSSTSYGGSIYIKDAVVAKIFNTSISFSNSTSGGGCFFIECTNVSVSDTIINGTLATSSSGGSLYGKTIENLIIERSIMMNCSSISGNGGGIFADSISNSILITGCLFSMLRASLSGGAMHISVLNPSLISESIFYDCSSQTNAGAIYIVPSSTLELKSLCFTCCYTGGNTAQHGHSIFITSSNTAKTYYINFTSLFSCGNRLNAASGNYLNGGTQIFTSLNISSCSSFSSSSLHSTARGQIIIQYSTIADSNSSNQDLYLQVNTVSSISLFYCNIIDNTVGTTNGCLIQVYESNQNTQFQFCMFFNNKCTKLINSASKCSIKSCIASLLGGLANNATSENYVSITGNTNTYTLNHFSTNYCQTPPELAPQELVCQTLMPTPTACIFPSDQTAETQLSLSTLLHFISLSLPVFY